MVVKLVVKVSLKRVRRGGVQRGGRGLDKEDNPPPTTNILSKLFDIPAVTVYEVLYRPLIYVLDQSTASHTNCDESRKD